MATFTLSQRDLEGILEDLDPIYRHIEDAEEIDEVRDYARILYDVARRLENLAGEYMDAAEDAECAEAEDTCPECGAELCATCFTCHDCEGEGCMADLDELEDGE